MLKELFESLKAHAAAGAAPVVQEIKGTDVTLVTYRDEQKEFVRKETPTANCVLSVESLSELLDSLTFIAPQALERRSRFLHLDGEKARQAIFVGQDCVVAIADMDVRADKVQLPLNLSGQFAALTDLDQSFSQSAVIRFLRIDLIDTGAEQYVPVFRDMKFDRSQMVGGKLNHADESLGRSVEQKVVAGQTIPEMLRLTVPVFANRDCVFKASILVFVTLNFESATIQLTVAPNQIEEALSNALESVRQTIKQLSGESDVLIVAGKVT